ncbi:MAG: F0F1 ATP synthase subunit A [Phycisphaerales bacterium]
MLTALNIADLPAPFLAEGNPMSHVVNQVALKAGDWWIWSSNQGTLVLAGLIAIFVGSWAANRIRTGDTSAGAEAYVTRNSFAHLIEVMCTYLRDEVARPLLHDRTDKLMPFLWTVFFFILINNLLGLIPIGDVLHILHLPPLVGGTPTQNMWVTAVLAVIAAVVFNGAAIRRLGVGGFVKHMMGGLPLYMLPIALLLLVIEAAGQFLIKPFALALRLFANMTAGHVLIAALLFIAGPAASKLFQGEAVAGNGIAMVVGAGAIFALTFLELFVAFLQAFVFMFLTAIFISLMDHHDEHGHEHEHDHAHGHEHAHA